MDTSVRKERMTEIRLKKNTVSRRKRTVVAAALAICLVLVFSGSLLVSAKEESTPEYKYYTSVQVKAGDTLWGLADQYLTGSEGVSRADYIRELQQINHLSGDNIYAGQTLTVVYYSAEYK